MKEEELAEWTIGWLEAQNWEIYQEVQVFSYGNVADIIGVVENVKLAVYTKCKHRYQENDFTKDRKID